MLKKKMLRDIKGNFAQFFSIFLLAAVAMWCFTGMQADVVGGRKSVDNFTKVSNFADGWIYGSGFDKKQAEKVAAISGVKDVQLRTEVLGKAEPSARRAQKHEEGKTLTSGGH